MRCLRVLTMILLAAPVFAQGKSFAPHGDWLHVPADTSSAIPLDRLLANDEVPPGPSPTFRLVDAPTRLFAWPAEQPAHLIFDARGLVHGTFTFEYELERAGGEAKRAAGLVSIIPFAQTVSGDWSAILSTASAGAGQEEGGWGDGSSTCELGEGGELGWYDARTGRFRLCDLQRSGEVIGCQDWPTPEALEQTPPIDPDFRYAMAGDWDGDGIDEPALYDPETGLLEQYDFDASCFVDESTAGCLEVRQQIFVDDPESSLPLMGDWRGQGLELARYDGISHQLIPPGGGAVSFFASPTAFPLAAAWNGGDLDTLGLWDDGAHTLHFLHDLGGGGAGTLVATNDGSPVHGYAFAGSSSSCGLGDYLGVLDPETGLATLISLDPGGPRGLHVKVVVDPGGGD